MRFVPCLTFLLVAQASHALAESPYLLLFKTAQERGRVNVEINRARQVLTASQFQRVSRLFAQNAVSRDEYDQSRAAAIVAELDTQIAGIKFDQTKIALELVTAVGASGQRPPLCRRRTRKPPPDLMRLVKPAKRPPPRLEQPRTGTQINIQPAEAPPPLEPPRVEPPRVDPPEPPRPEPPGGGGGVDAPVPQGPAPGPKPKPKPPK